MCSISVICNKGQCLLLFFFFTAFFPLFYFALSEDECVYFCRNVWLGFALLRNVNVTYMPRLFFSETFSFEGERQATHPMDKGHVN